MEEVRKQFDVVLDGIFYFFGFTENPANDAAKTILEESPADKLKNDIRKVNRDYRDKYLEMKKRALCVDK